MTSAPGKHVVVAPLDWGLGHATRCVPVIRLLLQHNCVVMLAGAGPSLKLLRAEFPDLPSLQLPAYNPVYPSGGSMVWKMALQLPKFIRVIGEEHRVIEQYIRDKNVDLVIADNRYGCWSSNVPSVFITHQSNIMMPKRFGWLAPFVRRANENAMQRFTEWWIPDSGQDGLAGDLTSFSAGVPLRFIGQLSRFSPASDSKNPGYDIVVICSGPEPQRTIFENLVRKSLQSFRGTYLLVRGILDDSPAVITTNGTIQNYLTSNDLECALANAGMVIARSGYSTVMDMAVLGKKVIFVPTPGQTEQEYLATRLMEKKIAFSMDQNSFELDYALVASADYTGFTVNPLATDHYLAAEIERILATI
jgi:uncharacterized protein (TIGR00661 family)